jgi:hypothetical protein
MGHFQSLEPSFDDSINDFVLEGLFNAEIFFLVPSNFVDGFMLGTLDVHCLAGDLSRVAAWVCRICPVEYIIVFQY